MKPEIRIYIDSDNYIDREMNDEEFEQYKKDQMEAQRLKTEESQLLEQKQAILDRLGITADEAKLILNA